MSSLSLRSLAPASKVKAIDFRPAYNVLTISFLQVSRILRDQRRLFSSSRPVCTHYIPQCVDVRTTNYYCASPYFRQPAFARQGVPELPDRQVPHYCKTIPSRWNCGLDLTCAGSRVRCRRCRCRWCRFARCLRSGRGWIQHCLCLQAVPHEKSHCRRPGWYQRCSWKVGCP